MVQMCALPEVQAVVVESRLPSRLHVQGGLPPFREASEFFINPKHQTPLFTRIECATQDLSFVLIDPQLLDCGYEPEVFEADRAEIGLDDGESALVYTIVNLSRGVQRATTNLVGPLLIHPRTGRAKQVVLKNAALYSSRHPLISK